jgi:hypothetical protein
MFYAALTRNSSLRQGYKKIVITNSFLFEAVACKKYLFYAKQKLDFNIFAQLYIKLYSHYRTILQLNWVGIGGEVKSRKVKVFKSTFTTLFREILNGAWCKPSEGKKGRCQGIH